MLVSWEREMSGRWVKVANHITLLPPVAQIIHNLEGPLAGSKFIFYYTPHGAKTGVSAVGEFTSPMIPAQQLESAVMAAFQDAFDRDNAYLKKMAGRA